MKHLTTGQNVFVITIAMCVAIAFKVYMLYSVHVYEV